MKNMRSTYLVEFACYLRNFSSHVKILIESNNVESACIPHAKVVQHAGSTLGLSMSMAHQPSRTCGHTSVMHDIIMMSIWPFQHCSHPLMEQFAQPAMSKACGNRFKTRQSQLSF